MIEYIIFSVLGSLPLVSGELLGIGEILLLASCLPLSIYLSKQQVSFSTKEYFFFGFLIFSLIATILSLSLPRSFDAFLIYMAYLIYFLAAGQLFLKRENLNLKWLLVFIILPSIILSCLSFIFLLTGRQPVFSSMNLFFANYGHSHLVDYLILIIPATIILFLKEKKFLAKASFFILNLILIGGLITSFSRGGFLMAVLIIVLVEIGLWYDRKEKGDKRKTDHVLGLR